MLLLFAPLFYARKRTPSKSLNIPYIQATGNGNRGERCHDFRGVRFQEADLAHIRGSSSRGETRRSPSSGLDVEAEADLSSREEDGDEGSCQHNHRGGVGRVMGRVDDRGGHRRDADKAEVGLNKWVYMKCTM